MREFFRAVGGALTHPYDTVTELVERRDWRTGVAIPVTAILVVVLTALWLPGSRHVRPFTGTLASIALFALTFIAAAAVVYWSCRAVGADPDWQAVFAAWGLTYVPTAGWFIVMLLSHLLVPGSALGLPMPIAPATGIGLLQGIFAVISVAFFLWKLLLYYFALRLAGGLSFPQIIKASLILAPIAITYWLVGLQLGLLKVPFI